VTESHTAVEEDTAIVRAPMGESIGHAFDNRWIYWVVSLKFRSRRLRT
jgi:hypothetical protein